MLGLHSKQCQGCLLSSSGNQTRASRLVPAAAATSASASLRRGSGSSILSNSRPSSIVSSPLISPPQHNPSKRAVACNGLFGLGLPEVAVIAGVAAIIFGPSKLPEVGKGLGKTVKSFQTAAKEFEQELKSASQSDEGEGQQQQNGQQPPASQVPPPPTSQAAQAQGAEERKKEPTSSQ